MSKEETKKLILELLSRKPCRVSVLVKETGMSRRSVESAVWDMIQRNEIRIAPDSVLYAAEHMSSTFEDRVRELIHEAVLKERERIKQALNNACLYGTALPNTNDYGLWPDQYVSPDDMRSWVKSIISSLDEDDHA